MSYCNEVKYTEDTTRGESLMKKITVVFLCIVHIFLLTSCFEEKQIGVKKIYIPILADASWLNSDGAFIHGVQMAVEDVNSEYSGKGFHITTQVIDDRALYEAGVEAASLTAKDDTVTAVFNLQNFDVSKTTAGILSENAKLTVFPYGAYDSLFTQGNPYV